MCKHFLKTTLYITALCVILFTPWNSRAQGDCSPSIDNNGYICLHPYFEGKNWKNTFGTIDIILPDTLCSQKLKPVQFDVTKTKDSSIAILSSANNDLFVMKSAFTPYSSGACNIVGELSFQQLQKVPLTGISFTEATPLYLIKDTLYSRDTIKIILATSNQFVLAVTIKSSIPSVVKIDTLAMQSPVNVIKITGDFNAATGRDTNISIACAAGKIRQFSYKRTSFGAETIKDLIGVTDTVTCVNGKYAGTTTGKIYKKNTSSVFVYDSLNSRNAINAIYPQGAIGSNGNFVELKGSSWRLDTLGKDNYKYANFIKRPSGFGVELLNYQWKYSVFSYRDSSSKIYMTLPGDRFSYVNGASYLYNPRAKVIDTGMSVYILDPDSNYSDLSITLKRASATIDLKTDGVRTIAQIPDTQTSVAGIIRLTDGIIRLVFKKDSVGIKAQSELGTRNVTCGTYYWKNFNYVVWQKWGPNASNDTLKITAGKSVFKVAYHDTIGETPVNLLTHQASFESFLRCKIVQGKLNINSSAPNISKIVVHDISGRLIESFSGSFQTSYQSPHAFSSSIVCVTVYFVNGNSRKFILPVVK